MTGGMLPARPRMNADGSAVEAAPAIDLVDARVRAREVCEWQERHDASDEEVPEHDLIVQTQFDQRKSGKSAYRSAELIVHRRSSTPAIACPCPMHIVAMP